MPGVLPRWWLAACLFWLVGPLLQAQPGPPVSLDLGIVAAMASAGDTAEMPLSLLNPGNLAVARVSVELGYSSQTLELVEFRKDPSIGEAVVTTSTYDSGFDGKVLRLEISSTPLPSSELGRIVFRIAKEVKLGSTLDVQNLKQAAASSTGETVPAAGIGGSIMVLGHASACFFYMH